MEAPGIENRERASLPWRLARAAIRALTGLALVGLVLAAALVVFGPAESDLRGAIIVAIFAVAAAIALLGALTRDRGSRVTWVILGLGILSYASGVAFLLYVASDLLAPFPQTSEVFRLFFYACVVSVLIVSVHRRRTSDRLTISLDAAIIALAIGALGYALIFDTLIDVSLAADVVAGQLAYSILDFAILVMLVIVCAPSRAKVGGAYIALGAGMLVIFVSDLVLVSRISGGTFVPGTLLEVGWPAGIVILALAARMGDSLDGVRALRGRSFSAAIAFSFLAASALLVTETLGEHTPVTIGLALAVLSLIMVRLFASVREADRLSQDNEAIINAAGEGIFRSDLRGRLSYANPAALAMLGYSEDEVLGRGAHALFHHTRANGAPYPAAECPTRRSLIEGLTLRVTDEHFWRKDGTSFAVDYTSTPIRESGRIAGAVTVFDDVTSQRQMKEQLRHQADHDSLTGLFNRRRFELEVSGQLSYAQRYSRAGALLLMDLDTFKFVNDSYGHPIGDQLLVDVGAIIEHRKRMADINSEFNKEVRDVERDIFNGRVDRMMQLAALEQELRYQGLTSEQQRADLLMTIATKTFPIFAMVILSNVK